MPCGKESQDSLLKAAFLTALLTNADEVVPGGSFFQIRQFSKERPEEMQCDCWSPAFMRFSGHSG